MSRPVELVVTDNSLPTLDFRSLAGALAHLRSWGSVWNGKPWRIYQDGVVVREGVGNPMVAESIEASARLRANEDAVMRAELDLVLLPDKED